MTTTTAEYDAFGPWIYEIHSEEEIPRLFKSHPIDLQGAITTIKVPREIERREANPSMDLYDMVVSFGQQEILVLTRRGREVDAETVAYGDIHGITEVVDLLRGQLVMHTQGEPVSIPFNASSTDIIAHVVQVLRKQYAPGEPPGVARDAGHVNVPAGIEDDLRNLYRRLYREGGLGRTVAIQRRHLTTPIGASGVGKVLAKAWPTYLQSAVVTLGEREVVVIHRAQPFISGRRPAHSLAHTLLPLDRLTGVEVRPSQVHEGVSSLLFRVGGVTHEFAFDTVTANKVVTELSGAVRT